MRIELPPKHQLHIYNLSSHVTRSGRSSREEGVDVATPRGTFINLQERFCRQRARE
jgi:hypothetical protein